MHQISEFQMTFLRLRIVLSVLDGVGLHGHNTSAMSVSLFKF